MVGGRNIYQGALDVEKLKMYLHTFLVWLMHGKDFF